MKKLLLVMVICLLGGCSGMTREQWNKMWEMTPEQQLQVDRNLQYLQQLQLEIIRARGQQHHVYVYPQDGPVQILPPPQ